jgi:hypothetical protein
VKIENGKHTVIIASILTCLGLASSCALYNPSQASKAVVKTCNIPSDQSGSIIGRWPTSPIPLSVHLGSNFSPEELAAISASIESWNAFFQTSKGAILFDSGATNGSGVRGSSANNSNDGGANFCGQSIIQGTQFISTVTLYKLGAWPRVYPSTAMAITTNCPVAGNPYPTFRMSNIELNYQGFFIAGRKLPDLQTIVSHELGHLTGLDHSCESFQKNGMPNCNDPNLNPEYSSALMFPSFGFDASGMGEQRRDLGPNDQSRVNCLYTGASPTGS